MSLENFLNPNLDQVGLQRNARDYALSHPELTSLYKENPVEFAYRFKRVVDSVAQRYLRLLSEYNPSVSTQVAQLAVDSKFSEKASNKLEQKLGSKGFRFPKGFGLFSLISGIPSMVSHYGAIKKETGDRAVASYIAFQDLLKAAVPFGDSLLTELSQSSEMVLGTTPLQKHIDYKLRDELRREFNLGSINTRIKAANRNYGPSKVKIRTSNH